jgi:hypothetical protein
MLRYARASSGTRKSWVETAAKTPPIPGPSSYVDTSRRQRPPAESQAPTGEVNHRSAADLDGAGPTDSAAGGAFPTAGRAIGYCVLGNGSILYDARNGQVEMLGKLDRAALEAVGGAIGQYPGATVAVYSVTDTNSDQALFQHGYEHQWPVHDEPPALAPEELFDAATSGATAYKVMARVPGAGTGTDPKLHNVAGDLSAALNGIATVTGTGKSESFEIVPWNVTKETGLKEVAKGTESMMKKCRRPSARSATATTMRPNYGWASGLG